MGKPEGARLIARKNDLLEGIQQRPENKGPTDHCLEYIHEQLRRFGLAIKRPYCRIGFHRWSMKERKLVIRKSRLAPLVGLPQLPESRFELICSLRFPTRVACLRFSV